MDEHAQSVLRAIGLENAKTIILPTLSPAQQKRLKLCGSYAVRINPSTGLPYRIRYKCKLWRHGCPLCLRERQLEFEKRFIDAQREVSGELRIIQRSKKDMDYLLRQTRAENDNITELYWRVPTEDGDLLLVDSELIDLPSDIEPEDLNWEELSQTPEGRNFSGRLGKDSPAPSEDDETFEITAYQVIARPGYGDTLTKAAKRALEQTKELDPEFDPEKIEDAYMKRHNAFLEQIEATGGVIIESLEKRLTVSRLLYGDGWKSSLQKHWIEPYSLDDPRGYDRPQYHPEKQN